MSLIFILSTKIIFPIESPKENIFKIEMRDNLVIESRTAGSYQG